MCPFRDYSDRSKTGKIILPMHRDVGCCGKYDPRKNDESVLAAEWRREQRTLKVRRTFLLATLISST